MNNTSDGRNKNPSQRNARPSAATGPVKPVAQAGRPVPRQARKPSSAPSVKKAPQARTNNAAQRPVQRNVQRPAAQRSVPQAAHKTAPNNTQRRPVNAAPKRAPQPARKVQKEAESKPVNTGLIIKVLMIAVAVIALVLTGVRIFLFYKDETGLLIREVTIEAGTVRPTEEMFFTEEPSIPKWVSCNLNFDEVNIDLPQTINFNMKIYGRNFPCKLIIQDTIAPVGQGIPQQMFACGPMPDASSCVTGISDITDVAVTWKEVPDMSAGGNFTAVALLTDGCGNETTVSVPFEVTKDSLAPEIKGALDIEAYIGDPVMYRNNVIVTDDYDENPVLDIDTSNVNLNEPGTYEVTYTASDFSGNETKVTINLKLSNKPEGYIEPEELYKVAQEILDEITEPGMTEEEVALQIIWWCRYNIRFILRTNTRSWTEAAYNAFKTRTGNCYSTAYAVKALLDVAGIDNMIIERYPYQTATHFWNYVCLNGQWYHCDATWREGYDSYFFMYTTEELLDFWQGGWNGFQFKKDKYPASATQSVQSRIDYKNHTIKNT
ncbi:MAG: hypothetical protein IKF31_00610 [Clostridiales bacterium]|nr:hypothetical protein [Clostridiales bacterium]